MALVTSREITNYYLYGQPTTPPDLATDGLIRPNTTNGLPVTITIQQSATEYMTDGGGRFAVGASFNLVENFFSQDPMAGGFLYGLQPGTYTKAQLAAIWGLNYYGLVLRQQMLDDGRGDYIERACIWNSGEFMIGDGAVFVVDPNGARRIQNFSVRPRGDDNFDFESNDFIAGPAGAMLNKDARKSTLIPVLPVLRVIVRGLRGRATWITSSAIVGTFICFAQVAAEQSTNYESFEMQKRALKDCPVPPSARRNYGLDLRNVPAGCTAWSDGCNRYARLENGEIFGTAGQCFHCPKIRCNKY